MKIVSFNELMVLMMLSLVSLIMLMVMSEGNVLAIFASSFLTPFDTCTELASVCFWMVIMAPWMPLENTFCRRSCSPSLTRATSFK